MHGSATSSSNTNNNPGTPQTQQQQQQSQQQQHIFSKTSMIQQESQSQTSAFRSQTLSEQNQRKLEMLESRFVPLNPQKSVSQDFSNQSLNSDEQKNNIDIQLAMDHVWVWFFVWFLFFFFVVDLQNESWRNILNKKIRIPFFELF